MGYQMNRFVVLGCNSPFPAPGGATPGYLLQVEGKHYLIDCGSGVLAQLVKYLPIHQLDGVFLSHLHSDHMSDFLTLQYAIWLSMHQQKRQAPLPVYTPVEPAERFAILPYKDAFQFQEITEGFELPLGKQSFIQFFQTQHGVPCYAMKIECSGFRLLYGADSGPETDWNKMGQGFDLVVLEATFPISLEPTAPIGHLSTRQDGMAATTLQAKELWSTHLFPELDASQLVQEAKETYAGICRAADIGLEKKF